jgi:hypothetical protein
VNSVNGYGSLVGFLRKINGYRRDKVLRRSDFENVKISSGVNLQYVASLIWSICVECSRNNETTKIIIIIISICAM